MRKRQRPARIPNNSTKAKAEFRVFGLKVTPVSLFRAGLAALATAVLFAALLTRVLPRRPPFETGDPSPVEIKAPRSATYTDLERTAKQQDEAASAVPMTLKAVPEADAAPLDFVARVFDRARRARGDPELQTQHEQIVWVQEGLITDISDGSISILVRCDVELLPQLEELTKNTVRSHMRGDVLLDDLPEHRNRIAAELERSTVSKWYRPAVTEVAQRALRHNRVVDNDKTGAERAAARAAVRPVKGQIAPGDIIIAVGETVTRQHFAKLEALGLIRPRVNYGQGVAVAAIVLCLVILFGLYLRERAADVYNSRAQLIFVAACVIVPVCVAQFSVRYGVFPAAAMSAASFSAMVLSALLAVHIAVVGSIVVGILCGLAASGSDPRMIVATTLAGIIAAFAVSFVARRTQVAVRAALITAAANLFVLLAANGAFGLRMAPNDFFAIVTGGILASVFAVMVVVVLDPLLGVTTDIRLAELANPNSPLLRRLMEEAPGTYMSTTMLAGWCETCAGAIGANPLLARVGTYYHDIGKLEKPFYFVENQFGERNPHDFLEPALSARVIARHTKDGYRLARQLRLPQKVRDMTRMHHGTSLIKYFYHKAKEQSDSDEVDESQFRHVGIKPRFKEAGILMIADTVEAAARTLNDPSPSAVDALVDRLTQDKIDDGQLDESDLTFDDVRVIKRVLVRTLNSMFHQRVPYPDDESGRT